MCAHALGPDGAFDDVDSLVNILAGSKGALPPFVVDPILDSLWEASAADNGNAAYVLGKLYAFGIYSCDLPPHSFGHLGCLLEATMARGAVMTYKCAFYAAFILGHVHYQRGQSS